MSGVEDHNFPQFHASARILRELGYEVVNPAENNEKILAFPIPLPRSTYLRHDLHALALCDAIAMLPGWSKSRGALMELHIALELEMPVYVAPTEMPDDPESYELVEYTNLSFELVIEGNGMRFPTGDRVVPIGNGNVLAIMDDHVQEPTLLKKALSLMGVN